MGKQIIKFHKSQQNNSTVLAPAQANCFLRVLSELWFILNGKIVTSILNDIKLKISSMFKKSDQCCHVFTRKKSLFALKRFAPLG